MPGKFEGEPPYTEYFWNLSLDGVGDEEEEAESGLIIITIEIEPSDIEKFPELISYKEIKLWEDYNGFVYHELTPLA